MRSPLDLEFTNPLHTQLLQRSVPEMVQIYSTYMLLIYPEEMHTTQYRAASTGCRKIMATKLNLFYRKYTLFVLKIMFYTEFFVLFRASSVYRKFVTLNFGFFETVDRCTATLELHLQGKRQSKIVCLLGVREDVVSNALHGLSELGHEGDCSE